MSDSKLGPGWWQATDGKWYPPESQPAPTGWWQATDGKWYPPQPAEPLPSPAPAAAEPPPSPAPAAAEKWWLRRVPLWTLLLAAVAGIALGAATTNSDNDEATSANSTEDTSNTERATTTTRRSTTTTTRRSTTTAAPTTAAPPAEAEISTFEGSGASTTRPFTVPDGWEIQWNATGSIFQLFVYDAGGELANIAANQQGSGEGSAYQTDGGTFHLQMNAIGSWTVRVVDVN